MNYYTPKQANIQPREI